MKGPRKWLPGEEEDSFFFVGQIGPFFLVESMVNPFFGNSVDKSGTIC